MRASGVGSTALVERPAGIRPSSVNGPVKASPRKSTYSAARGSMDQAKAIESIKFLPSKSSALLETVGFRRGSGDFFVVVAMPISGPLGTGGTLLAHNQYAPPAISVAAITIHAIFCDCFMAENHTHHRFPLIPWPVDKFMKGVVLKSSGYQILCESSPLQPPQ